MTPRSVWAERRWIISFWTLGKGWVVQFSATHGGGSSFSFLPGIGSYLTIDNRGNYLFPDNRDDKFIYCKICTKAKKSNGLSKETKGRNFKILCSADMLVFSNTKWSTCVGWVMYFLGTKFQILRPIPPVLFDQTLRFLFFRGFISIYVLFHMAKAGCRDDKTIKVQEENHYI